MGARDYLTGAGAVVAAVATAIPGAQAADAPLTPVSARPNALAILNNPAFDFKDQYGKSFKPETLKGKPFILAFGFHGCQLCDQVGATLGAIQEKFLARGAEIPPIVVVSIHPTADKLQMQEYVADYEAANVKQFPDKNIDYEAGKDLPHAERKLHILAAANDAQPGAMQDNLFKEGVKTSLRLKRNPDSHTLTIMLCDKQGKVASYDHGAVPFTDKPELNRLANWALRIVDTVSHEKTSALMQQESGFTGKLAQAQAAVNSR